MANINYKKIRRYNSDIHVVEFKPNNDLQPILTAGDHSKRQPLSKIENDWMISQGYKPMVKINAGFFYYVSNVQTVGLDYYDWGRLEGQASLGGGAETIWTGDKLIVEDMSHETFMNEYYQKAHWGTSLSYRLVKDGKANTEFASRYDHANTSNPRTMIGQKANGELVFAVAEGRNSGDKGLTAKEQANVMVELGCITAVNADGGGSSEMITYQNGQKKIVNYLSDGSERQIGNAIVLYAKGDVTWNGNGANTSQPETPSASANGRHIVLDAGHGGEDPGASGNGLIEKNVTLEVTLEVGKRLREHGFKVTYTRETDKNVGNASERGKIMGSVGADYGLSIHVNSASSKTASGAELLVPMKERYAYIEAALKEHFSSLYKFRKVASRDYSTGDFYDRPISNRMFAKSYTNKDYYGIIREAWAKGLSADIIELFFISNPDDVKFYTANKTAYVEAIVKSICQGYDITYTAPKVEEPKDDKPKKMFRAIAGSYSVGTNLDPIIMDLSSKGFTGIWTQHAVVSGKEYIRVICGSYENRSTAEGVVQKLIAAGYEDAWLNAVEV